MITPAERGSSRRSRGGLDRVAAAGLGRLLAGGFDQVEAQHVGQADQVDGDVAQFGAHAGAQLRVVEHCRGLGRGQPLEFGQQFADLGGQGHRQVLRGVEALPVAVHGERADLLGQLG
jgi:hypothetical protein